MNTNIYFIPLLDIDNFSTEVENALRSILISLGDIDSMDKFGLTIDGYSQEFEVYTQYELAEILQVEYVPDSYIITGDEELISERNFVPFIIFKPTNDTYTDFERIMFIKNIDEYREAQYANKE